MLRSLILSATLIFAATIALQAQPSQDEIAEGRLLYINGDYEAALKILVPAAEAGDANAQNIVADAYDEGNGVEADPAKAVEWWEKSAAQDFSRAIHNLGHFYQADDPEKSRSYYERSAAQGNAGSMNDLGWMYQTGAFGDPEYGKAVDYFEQAIAEGHTVAMNNLGMMYYYSRGVEEDMGKAFDLFETAAAAGDLLGFTNLATMYYFGYGTRGNPVVSTALNRMAAIRGSAKGAVNLAYDLIEKDNGLADPARGWAWCLYAVENSGGDPPEFKEDCDYLAEQLDAPTLASGEAIAKNFPR